MDVGELHATLVLDVDTSRVDALIKPQMSRIVLAFVCGVLVTLMAQRWYALESAAYHADLRLSYIEGYLEQASK